MTNFAEVRKEECIQKQVPNGVVLNSNRTVILQSVLNAIKGHGRSSMDKEVCGVLTGSLCWDNGPYMLIDSRIELDAFDPQAGGVAFTAETWNCAQYEHAKNNPDKKIIGWYHTHPGFGVFLSNMDSFVQETFFSASWQCVYVFDPQMETDGFFFRTNGRMSKGAAAIVPDEPAADKLPVSLLTGNAGFNDRDDEDKEEFPVQKKLLSVAISFVALLVITGLIAYSYFLQQKLDDLQKENTESKLALEIASSVSRGKHEAKKTPAVQEETSRSQFVRDEEMDALKKQIAALETKLNESAEAMKKLEDSCSAKDAAIKAEQEKVVQRNAEIRKLFEKLAASADINSRNQQEIQILQQNEIKYRRINKKLADELASQKDRMDFLEKRWDEYMSHKFNWYKPQTWF